jgi:steroid delta-isomerase-like uncharacterized protein
VGGGILAKLMSAMSANSAEAVAALYSDDCVISDPLMKTTGRDGLLGAVQAFFAAFRIESIKVDECAEDPPHLVALCSWTVTHQGEYLGVPASGRRLETWNVMWLGVRDGLICRDTSVWDASQLRRLEALRGGDGATRM